MKTLAAIPCHDEGLAIGSVVLKARKYVDEVLVVDDGSTDDTVEVAAEAGAVVVSHGVNKGKGSAVRTSLGYAAEHGFDALVLLDGDGQHDPGEIPELLEHWRTRAFYWADAECDFEVEWGWGHE